MAAASEALVIAGGGLEDVEYILDDVRRTLACLEKKRSTLQDQIAAASRGRRAHHRRGAPVAAEAYTRKGAGAVRKRLRAAAGDVKKERERLEAVRGTLQEAAVDARERLALTPPAA